MRRLGEKKHIVEKVLNDQNQIAPITRDIFGGQAKVIDNWGLLSQALNILLEEKWLNYDEEKLKQLKDFIEENTNDDSLGFSDQEESLSGMQFYHLINEFINHINPTMPIWHGIVDSIEGKQKEQVINIKLKKDNITFDELVEINQRWSVFLKKIDLNGTRPTIKFDKGSNWLVVLIDENFVYFIAIAALHICQEILISIQEFYKTKDYKITYRMAEAKAKAENKKLTEEEHKKDYYESAVNSKIDEIIELFFNKDAKEDAKGRTPAEVRNQLKFFYDFLKEEIDKHGSEIHPSLNPPKYISEEKGKVKIDVNKMKAIYKENQKSLEKKPEQKQVESKPSIEENK